MKFMASLGSLISKKDQRITTLNGDFWNNANEGFKLGFAAGFTSGSMATELEREYKRRDRAFGLAKTAEEFMEAMAAFNNPEPGDQHDWSNVNFCNIIDGMNRFYKDSLNYYIEVWGAACYIFRELFGATPGELRSFLNDLRSIALNRLNSKQKGGDSGSG